MLDLNCYQPTNIMFIKIRVSRFRPGFVIWGIIFGISGTFCEWNKLLTWMTQPAILKPGSKQTCKDHLQTSPRQTMQDWQMKRHLHETAEPGGVVVPDGLGIAKGLEDGVGLEDLLLNPR